MAKRRRLAPVDPETTQHQSEPRMLPENSATLRRRGVPIADVAGAAAEQAAFDEVAQALRSAREEGRLVQRIPLAQIRRDHLLRDRLMLDEDEMTALCASLAARGQQTPVEVMELAEGDYGLISGLRRVEALHKLGEETALALVRAPEGAEAAYVAMVEENEIRANLSFYERAQVAAEAARIKVYPSAQAAVQSLFAHTTPSKRSKILSFVVLHDEFGAALRFPAAIPEKLGLALVKALKEVPGFSKRVRDQLKKSPPADISAERAVLEQVLRRAGAEGSGRAPEKSARKEKIGEDLFLEASRGRVVLQGAGLDADLVADLRRWLTERGR